MRRDRPAPASRRVTPGLGPTTLTLSLALHAAGLGLVYGLPRLLPRAPGGPPVYVVDLVSLPAAAATRPAAAGSPPRASPPPAPARAPGKPIKIPDRDAPKPPKPAQAVKPKPEPVKPEPPRPEPPRSETPATSAPGPAVESPQPAEGAAEGAPSTGPAGGAGAATGGPGGVGVRLGEGLTGSGTMGDEYTFYLSLLNRNIRRAWREPLYTGTAVLSATVGLEVSSTGRVMRLDLTTASGYGPLDRSVLRAVRDAEPFPPFPHFLRRDSLAVQIIFDLTPKGQSSAPPGD